MSVPYISKRARQMARSRAAIFMGSQCEISRPKNPSIDIDTGLTGLAGERTVVYTGKCRVWEVTGGNVTVFGEDEIVYQNTNISIPWDSNPVPIKGDYIKITSSPVDTNLIGRIYVITDMAKSGELRATRRFAVRGVQERVHGELA